LRYDKAYKKLRAEAVASLDHTDTPSGFFNRESTDKGDVHQFLKEAMKGIIQGNRRLQDTLEQEEADSAVQ